MPTAWRNVRFRGRSGKHMLGSSFSGFDPGCVKTCASLGCPESFLICLLPTEVASAISFYSHEIEMEILRASWASEFSHSLDQRPTRPDTGADKVCSRYNFPSRKPSTLVPLIRTLRSCHCLLAAGAFRTQETDDRLPFSNFQRTRLFSRQFARSVR